MRKSCRMTSAAVLASAILVSGSVAYADRVMPASACQPSFKSADGYPLLVSGQWLTASNESMELYCPFVDTVGDWKSSVSTISIDANDGSTSDAIYLLACSVPYGGGSAHCGGIVTSGTTYTGSTTSLGENITGTDVSNAWGSMYPYDYGYVEVELAGSSMFRGLYLQ
jgi:hypothetical protein